MNSRRGFLKMVAGAVVAPVVPVTVPAPAKPLVTPPLPMTSIQQQLMLWLARKKSEAIFEALAAGKKPPLVFVCEPSGAWRVEEAKEVGCD